MTERDEQIEIPEGRPFQDLERTWTIEELKAVAKSMGKRVNPNRAGSFEKDLAEGALVLLNDAEVVFARQRELIPSEWLYGLLDEVTRKNQLLVVPKSAFAMAAKEMEDGRPLGKSSYDEATKYCEQPPQAVIYEYVGGLPPQGGIH